jgi:hypothetical protein
MSNSPWLVLIPFFGFLVYSLVLLGLLWIAVRIVRHAWYWQPASASDDRARQDSANPSPPSA